LKELQIISEHSKLTARKYSDVSVNIYGIYGT